MKTGLAILHDDGYYYALHGNDLVQAVIQAALVIESPEGTGTLDDPFVPKKLKHWLFLAQRKEDKASSTIYIQVGERLIAKWGKAAGGLKNYTSDITSKPDLDPSGQTFKTDVHAASPYALGQSHEAWHGTNPSPPKEVPIYATKGFRSYYSATTNSFSYSSRDLAQAALSIVFDNDESPKGYAPEVYNTVCGLLISESGVTRVLDERKTQLLFVSTIMLFDLIHAEIKYGHAREKFFSWANMLAHQGTAVPTDPWASLQIPGRAALGAKHSTLSTTTYVAKHPMAGVETVSAARSMNVKNFSANNFVAPNQNPTSKKELKDYAGAYVPRRILTIVVTWCAHLFAKNNIDVKIIADVFPDEGVYTPTSQIKAKYLTLLTQTANKRLSEGQYFAFNHGDFIGYIEDEKIIPVK
jgi:hypothetical protein